jgi:hypothetical protein
MFWGATLGHSAITSDGRARLQKTSGTAETLQQFNIEPADTLDIMSVVDMSIWTSSASPTSETFAVQFSAEAGTTTIRDAYLTILELFNGEQGNSVAAEASTTVATFSNSNEITLPSGSWYIIGSMGIRGSSTGPGANIIRVQLSGSNGITNMVRTSYFSKDNSNYTPYFGLAEVSHSVDTTYYLQYSENSNITLTIQYRSLLGLKKTNFYESFYSASEEISTTTATATSSKLSLPFTASVADPVAASPTFVNAQTSQRTATTDPYTFTYTPDSTIQGILVFANNYTTATDQISTITYGGQSLTRIITASDAAGEPAHTSAWFLGSTSLPTGAQTVSVDLTSATDDDYWFTAIGISNDVGATNRNIILQSSGSISGDATDPQIALTTGGNSCMGFTSIYSGLNNVGGLTPVSGMTNILNSQLTQEGVRVDYQTNASTDNYTIGYTAASDDVAMVAVNFRVGAAPAPTANFLVLGTWTTTTNSTTVDARSTIRKNALNIFTNPTPAGILTRDANDIDDDFAAGLAEVELTTSGSGDTYSIVYAAEGAGTTIEIYNTALLLLNLDSQFEFIEPLKPYSFGYFLFA